MSKEVKAKGQKELVIPEIFNLDEDLNVGIGANYRYDK